MKARRAFVFGILLVALSLTGPARAQDADKVAKAEAAALAWLALTDAGDLVSRKVKSARYAESFRGAPDGEYVVVQYETRFKNKKIAMETVTPLLEKDGSWKVSGYYIR